MPSVVLIKLSMVKYQSPNPMLEIWVLRKGLEARDIRTVW
jgi:hypothetical protein